ncbi:hypothetical protein BDW75DRAFT_241742 [Aspergillus navahoensis]
MAAGGGVAACATASGTAAVSMTLMALAGVGDNIVALSTVHGKVFAPQLGNRTDRWPRNHVGRRATKFTQFDANGASDSSGEVSLWKTIGRRAFAMRCQFEAFRDIGSTMAPQAAQQLLIGLERWLSVAIAIRPTRVTFVGIHGGRECEDN